MQSSFTYKSLRLVVRTTSCIVTTPPSISSHTTTSRVLVVPGNTALCGTAFPYFPHPEFDENNPTQLPKDVPPSSWGGVSIGDHQFYPIQCIDGTLQLEAPEIRKLTKHMTCQVGNAIMTKAPTVLSHYDAIYHVVPPLYNVGARHDEEHQRTQQQLLQKSYLSALQTTLLDDLGDGVVVAMPLLGCGSRGAAPEDSITAAIAALEELPSSCTGTIEFSMQRKDLAEQLLASLLGMICSCSGTED